MTASDLLNSSQKFFVNSGLGMSKSIEYRHKDGTAIPSLNVFSNELDMNKIKSDKGISIATLSNVYLDQKPCQNDRVRFDGETDVWRVQSWRKPDESYILEITSQRYKV